MKRKLINIIKHLIKIRKKPTNYHRESDNFNFRHPQFSGMQVGPRELPTKPCSCFPFPKIISDTQSSSNNLNNAKPQSSLKRSWDEYL